ncbi:ac92-like protein, putative sulfhydryl oxidase-2 [Microplitis demolitor]|uniref:Bracovirus particle protein p33-2 n=1 Tax=Microplitis demolitor TaxID=69319 RepID=UPI00043FFF94|nr:ac92-like protein, putative sulfhydryl oxidase-2 [Microplitis demolitor]KAG6558470.1 ac92-like protein, putative sulfhydryl oxidase-2 [Microplitis demolitor]
MNQNKIEDMDGDGDEFHYQRTLQRNTYVINRGVIDEIKKQFKIYLNIFLAYIRSQRPILPDYFKTVTFGRFFKKIFMLIALVIDPIDLDESFEQLNKINDITMCNSMLYEQCRQFFGLSSILEPLVLEPSDWALDVWGKNYWNFLHSLSILVQYEYQQDQNHSAMDYLALVMVNFHIILPCSMCSHHYKQKNPLLNIALPILYGKDAISVVYDLHNDVRIQNGSNIYPFENFLEYWGIDVSHSETIEIDVTEPLNLLSTQH